MTPKTKADQFSGGTHKRMKPNKDGEVPMMVKNDPHDLSRFLQAQAGVYEQALSEIHAGLKRSHWMWYIFPQFDGLGFSSTSRRYSIKSIAEAEVYLKHPVLGLRLVECCEALLGVHGRSALDILGTPDDMKLCSSATLFSHVSAPGSVFDDLLVKFFDGVPDRRTVQLISNAQANGDENLVERHRE